MLGKFEQQWFSAQLAAANEKPLLGYQRNKGDLILRFTWLPSFDHSVVVRVVADPRGEVILQAKRLSGAGGYDPGKVADQVDRRLSREEWSQVEALMQKTDLLGQPQTGCDLGFDGSEWIVEEADDGGYHFLKRWSPQEGPVREIGLLLLKLAGWRWKANDIY